MVAQYIETQLVIYLCLEAERRPLLQVPRRWWKQVGMVTGTCKGTGLGKGMGMGMGMVPASGR